MLHRDIISYTDDTVKWTILLKMKPQHGRRIQKWSQTRSYSSLTKAERVYFIVP